MARLRLLAFITLIALIGGLILTPASLAQGPLPLDQTFTSADGQISFNYPNAWSVGEAVEEGQIRLANNDTLANAEPEGLVLLPGQVYVLFVTPTAIADAISLTGATVTNPVELIDLAAVIFGVTLPEAVTETTIGENPAAVTPPVADPNTGIESYLVAIQFGPAAFMLVAVNTPTGELAAFEPTAQAILESLTYGDEGPPPDGPTETPPPDGGETPTDAPTEVPTEITPDATATTAVPTEVTAVPTEITPIPTTPVPVIDQTFLSADGTTTFLYPAGWSVAENPVGLPGVIAIANNSALVNQDPANLTLLPGQAHISFLMPTAVDAFLAQQGVNATAPLQVVALLIATAGPTAILDPPFQTTIGAYPAALVRGTDTARGQATLRVVIQVGTDAFFIITVSAPTGELATLEPTALAIIASLSYNPAALPAVTATPTPTSTSTLEPTPGPGSPTFTPTSTALTPPPITTEPPPGVTVTPVTPTATPIPRPQDTAGTLRLIYNNGTMTVYNGTNDLLDLRGIEFVAPDSRVKFITRDFGAFSLTFFEPNRCIHVHLFSQAYSPPEFCADGPVTTDLGYQSGSTAHLYFVWNPNFGYTSFLVQRNGQTIATCEIAAGQCAVPVPVTNFPIEVLEQ